MAALVVSDLHLDPARPEIAAQFREFLAAEGRDASALYVLGDLFGSGSATTIPTRTSAP